jgi:hypothetical protein
VGGSFCNPHAFKNFNIFSASTLLPLLSSQFLAASYSVTTAAAAAAAAAASAAVMAADNKAAAWVLDLLHQVMLTDIEWFA